jgi:glycosyltransferase involved in cell wall biosynthesis
MKLSFIVPVYNEEIHIERLLNNLKKVSDAIFIVDSGSNDKTLEIALKYGCACRVGSWTTFSDKMNWAIENTPYQSEWVMRVDADEYLSNELCASLVGFVSTCDSIEGDYNYLTMKKDFFFLGRHIKYGGYRNLRVDRIFKRNIVRYENRRLDEQLINTTKARALRGSLIENSSRSFEEWIEKHIKYARLEVKMILSENINGDYHQLSFRRRVMRLLKINFYYRFPILIRPFLYWFYRYFILLGFLDGREGFIYHYFHAFVYRELQDAFILEKKIKPN